MVGRDFIASRELARRQQQEGYEKFTAERDRLQQRQQTQREWAVQGVKNAKAKKTDNDKFLPRPQVPALREDGRRR